MTFLRAAVVALFVALLPAIAPAQVTASLDADPRVRQMVAAVSEARLRALATTLVSFGTRESMSSTTSPTRGIGAARQWIFDELTRSSPRLQVSFDTHIIAPQGRFTRQTELRNVMAVLPGRSPRRIYITGHYDSLNLGSGGQQALNAAGGQSPQASADFDHDADANGANDDGSGTVLTMELARVFAESGLQFDATLVFICWAGEEQGLVGSSAHAQALAAAKVPVEANFNNDIVGNIHGGNGVVDAETVRVYSVGPDDSMSRSLARYVQRLAAIYVPSHRIRLMAREDRFGRGSDHSSFTRQGFPAVVFREANENFAKQHTAADTLEGVDFPYLAQNARVNTAAAAALALAPAAPSVVNERGQNLLTRGPSGYDAQLRWNASPGAVGYRISWRDTWTNDWQHRQAVGNVTEFVLPNVSIDDFVFGVSAISADGHESLTSAYVTPVRQSADIKTVK